jgi:catechol 2,3-dioxygenase-like lactoylglutathione lyase family enzyme
MTRVFDRIVMAVPDLQAAIEQYRQLFDIPPFIGEGLAGAPTARWGLPNTVVELELCAVERPCLQGIVFNAPGAGPAENPVENTMDIDVRQGDGSSTEAFRRQHQGAQSAVLSVDHVVLRTVDAQACIDLFNGELGVRLALDKTVPEWGGRMLFFRAGKLTLEVIASEKDASSGNAFWGIAYQCQDLTALVQQLEGRGVAVSGIREGRKPGTQVATLKSHCLEIPTLLIQPAT